MRGRGESEGLLKKHLCIDARFIHASGIGTFLKILLAEISKEKRFFLSILHRKDERDFFLRYKPDQLIAIASSHFTLKEQLELPFKIPSCDLFCSPHFNIPIFPIRARKRVTTLQDVYHLAHFSSLTLLQKLYAKTMYFATCQLSDQLTTISEFSKKEILKYCRVDEKKVEAISLGVTASFFPRAEDVELRKKIGLPEKYLLNVTNFKPHKNFERIKEASAGILPLVVVGKKREESDFISTGHLETDELAFVYSHATALLFPSLYEGFGLPPIEALACGCPVVVSNREPFKEVLEEAAEYVDPLDVVSIRKGILNMLNVERRNQIIKNGFNLCQRKKAEFFSKRYLDLIERLL